MIATNQPPLPATIPAAIRRLVTLPMMPLSLRPVMGAALPLAHFALALFITLLLRKDLTAVWPATMLVYTDVTLEIAGLLPRVKQRSLAVPAAANDLKSRTPTGV